MFPAPAGINPGSAGSIVYSTGVPRASGDKPSFEAFRAWAIMCSPRQRG
ncbi:hypothetical protein ECDEC6E_3272 [Escherichia coli DEC6E]|nr:hypothetical protein ECDEC6D_3301 [Escherichia coli DEC6D]EHV71417.1 hypothetical protein ECDEC6E_3272 [Escherichia coli DEC6E]EII46425.1 hypothetical protein EC23916_3781 [Escherichia coli 2.3916]EZK17960.1 hypothetical protein AB39_3114 [Escherichia coli 1-176-05_S1_C2]KDU61688.1 hypothetical protein AB21_3077 [Escherichia coli 4-203-08_S1_C1]KDX94940.1 hypothetical protein AB89_3252 [Escherichia coli 2-316-03_S3_C1]KEK93426.1 hypothetical protein AB49_2809 [Escherichia coli 4-203-08_S1_